MGNGIESNKHSGIQGPPTIGQKMKGSIAYKSEKLKTYFNFQ
jgi:hypothetical protein